MQLTELINPTRSSLPSIPTTSKIQQNTLNLPTYTSIYSKQSQSQSQSYSQPKQEQSIVEPLKKISLPPISDILAQQQQTTQDQLPSVSHLPQQSSYQSSIQSNSSTPSSISSNSQQSYFTFNAPGNRSPNSNSYTTTTTTNNSSSSPSSLVSPNISSPSTQIPYYTQQIPQYNSVPPPQPQQQQYQPPIQQHLHQYTSQYSPPPPPPHFTNQIQQPSMIRSNSYPERLNNNNYNQHHLPQQPLKIIDQTRNRKTRNNLPKEITYILLRWLNDHLNHPYPNSFEKNQLMLTTGLNQQQLSNWFINARRRKIKSLKEQKRMNLI
ncbi:CUP9 [Candida pseudojiufengensis]|uniref:CUP9 n=1 Tax=Candida pseudojiufengensis TaxID=497109 RepID=UPI0022241CEF|nr:CUP9 [Candida pseudojiufengensis]KAI5960739.1 CUP9 [Candida pseudojiufengensis]